MIAGNENTNCDYIYLSHLTLFRLWAQTLYLSRVTHTHTHTHQMNVLLFIFSGKAGSMPDLRRHLASRQSMNHYPQMLQPPPAYWQHLADRQHMADRQYAASLRGVPKTYQQPQMYGTWVGPRSAPYDNPYKRRHSIVGAFDEYPKGYEYEDRMDCKSEMAYPYYRQYPYDPRMYGEYDPRFYPEFKREDSAYGVNLLRHEPYHFGSRERVFYSLRNSHTSVGNESDDLTKYKDVAL